MRKWISVVLIAACAAAPSAAFARIGPSGLGWCEIAEWLGVTFVKECEDGV